METRSNASIRMKRLLILPGIQSCMEENKPHISKPPLRDFTNIPYLVSIGNLQFASMRDFGPIMNDPELTSGVLIQTVSKFLANL